MSGVILSAAALTGISVALLARLALPPRRTILRRLAPYFESSRIRLGGDLSPMPGPVLYSEATRRVLGPLVTGLLGSASRLLGLSDREGLELRLRQAGSGLDLDEYRRRHLRWSILTPLGLGAAGIATRSGELVAAFFVCGCVVGVRRLPDQLRGQARRRNDRIRNDLPSIAALLSPKLENRKSLMTAVSEVVEVGSGPVADDLAHGLHLIAAGFGEAAAFAYLAQDSAEPAAARFYRFLGAASRGGIDLPRALLDQADTLRTQRREEVERSAARRQMSMVLPDLVFMAPVLLLFLLAPIPQLLFGHS
jgi:tight adherence protein C